MKRTLSIVYIFACTLSSFAQTQLDLRTQGKNVDFSAASSTRPMKTGASLPGTCNPGELFFLTTAQPGVNVYGCAAANIWNPEGSGGSVYSVSGKTGTVILQATDLSDCKLLYLSTTVLLVNNCPFSYPDLGVQTAAAGSITNLGGSGTIYVYAAPGGAISVLHSGSVVIACIGCRDAGIGNAFPPDVAEIGVWAATTTPGVWNPSAVSDQRTLVSGPPQIAPDTGILITLNSSSGLKTIGIDPAVVETLPDAQAGQELLCSATGTAAAQTCAMMPTLTVYTPGMRIHLLSGATNTGASTINIDNIGAAAILRPDGVTALSAGDITAANYYDLTYDGTVFRLQSASSTSGGGNGGGASLPASAAVIGSNAGSQAVAATGHSIVAPLVCADSSGSATATSCATTPSFTPAAGDSIIYSTTTANAGALTLNVNSSGAKAVRKWLGASALAGGDIPANVPLLAVYDGTFWEVQTIGNAPSGGGATGSTFDYKDIPLGVLQGTSGCALANSFLTATAPACYLFTGSSTTPQLGRPQFAVGNAVHVSFTLPADFVSNSPLTFRWDWINPADSTTAHTNTWGIQEYSCTASGGVLQPTMVTGANAAAAAIAGNATNTSTATLTLTPSGSGAGNCVGGSTLNFIATLTAATSTDNPVLTTMTVKYYRQLSH